MARVKLFLLILRPRESGEAKRPRPVRDKQTNITPLVLGRLTISKLIGGMELAAIAVVVTGGGALRSAYARR
jgi:hypothetical protein